MVPSHPYRVVLLRLKNECRKNTSNMAWNKGYKQKKLFPNINIKWSQNISFLGITFTDNLHDTIEINYDSNLKEIENVLKAYSKIHLSLIGEITVIKTLVIPKLVYLLSVLPWPGLHFIQTVEDMFHKLIWNNGKARISLSQLQKDIPDGGLKLTDLVTFNCALK